MGYFKKKLLLVLLLFLFISFCVSGLNKVYATQNPYDTYDTEWLLIQNFEESESTFMSWCDQYLQNNGGIDNTTDTNISRINDIFAYVRAGNFLYFDRNSNGTVYCWLIPKDLVVSSWDTSTWTSPYTNISYTISGKGLNNVTIYYLNNGNINVGTFSGWFMAKSGFKKLDFATIFMVNKYLPSSSGTGSSIDVNINGWNNMLVMLNQVKEEQENTTDEVKKLNNFMSSEDVDQDAYNFPTTNNTSDPSSSGFNGIFTQMYNAVTNWNSSGIVFPIPFSQGQTIIVPGDLTENIVEDWVVIKPLLSLVWYFLVSLYIVKDIQKYVDNMKTGEILSKSDTNIKSDML